MLISMRKFLFSIGLLLNLTYVQSQTFEQQLGYLLTDALLYSERYIIPATDAAVYQASSSWMNSAKVKKKWALDVGIHTNVFFVPNRDRSFQLSNSELNFFQIEGASEAVFPTALGDDNQFFLVGDLDGEIIRLKSPKGIDQETVIYPYLQTSLGLPHGFELIARYSTRTKLKKGDYQVYGIGLKHNISQYFPNLTSKKYNIAIQSMYSSEEIRFDFLDIQTANGNLGLDRFSGKVNTYHFQLGASKEISSVELLAAFIVNVSSFEYAVSGSNEQSIYAQAINQIIPELEETKWNYMGELSMNYFFHDFFLKTSFSFGKFANINIGLNYTINN